jgi:hypothetical protein
MSRFSRYGGGNTSNLHIPSSKGDRVDLMNHMLMWDWRNVTKNKIIRLLPGIRSVGSITVPIVTKDGQKKAFSVIIPSWDGVNHRIDNKKAKKDPYMTLINEYGVNLRPIYYMNAIIRELQEGFMPNEGSKSERKTGFMDGIESTTRTPVRVIRIVPSLMEKIQEKAETNIHKGKMYGVEHEKYGRDLYVKYDKESSGTDMYRVPDSKPSSELTDDEMNYYIWNLWYELEFPSVNEMKRSVDSAIKILDLEKLGIYSNDKEKNNSVEYSDVSSDGSDIDVSSNVSSDDEIPMDSDTNVGGKKRSKKSKGKKGKGKKVEKSDIDINSDIPSSIVSSS